ncbi:sulfite exporter TauE/SafE family protein [Mumia sp. ZJ430]|uniref:sulfite exporter TauE/SafE family protein n=1 Tax=Mumia sp. ZJ430 TaxID=2708083 RepID=UPI00141EDFE6|nr:sulfite exporter TauE/SafE family protein [Mumia sp. ZJ430]
MSVLEMALVLLAGVGAGVINTVVGSGTLITFPTLVAFGVPPVTATMSNAIGLVPGNVTGSFGYRRELAGQAFLVKRLLPASLLGSVVGAYLLLHLPEDAFIAVVPVLLVLALVLVVVQPPLQRWLKARREASGAAAVTLDTMSVPRKAAVAVTVFLSGIYGGYFAAAQGILLMGALGLLVPLALQRMNALKNVLVLGVNVVSATTYIVVATWGGGTHELDWTAVGLVAAGSLVGGVIGAGVGRRLPPALLRACIIVLGLVALYNILGMR